MQQRLDHLSSGTGEVVRVAAVLPDRFSAGLLAAMLERQPASLLSARRGGGARGSARRRR